MLSLDLNRAVASAEASFERGDFSSALEMYRAILLSRLEDPHGAATAFDATVVERVADLATLFGHYSAAEDLLIALSERFGKAGGLVGADHALMKLCSVRFAQEHLTGARHALEQVSFINGALDTVDAVEPANLEHWERLAAPAASPDDRALLCSRFYLEFSRLLAAHGFYQRAFDIARRGGRLASQSASEVVRHAIPALVLAAAAASVERGDIATGDRLLLGDATDAALWQHPAWAVRRLEITAKARLLCGDFGAAKAALDDVLGRCTRGGFDAAAAHAAINLAHALVLINQTRAAVDLLATAQRRAEAAHDVSAATRAARLMQVAMLRAMSLADGVAIAPSVSQLWLEDTVGTAASAGEDTDPPEMPPAMNYLTLFEDRALLFHWHLGRRDWDAARTCLSDISATVAHTDSMLITARLLAMESMLLYYTEDYSTACEGFSETAQVFGDLGLMPDRWQAQRFLGWTLKRLGQGAEAERTIQHAEHTLDVLTSSLADDDRAIFRLNKWTADEEFLGAELAAIAEMVRSAAHGSWWRRFFLEWRVRKRLALFLSRIDRYQRVTFGRTISAESTAPDAWCAKPVSLRPARDTAVLGFLVLPDRVFIGRLCRGRADVFVQPLTRLAVRELVSTWHTALVAGGPSRASGDRMSRLSRALGFERLLDALPAGVRHLTIVADDSLRGVPFGAFDYEGQPVIAKYSVTTAFAWSTDAAARRQRPAGLAVGVGNGVGNLPPLEHAGAEIAMVDRWLTRRRIRATRLENETATRAAVIARMPGSTHVHVASHGIFRRDRPDRSGLVMSGGHDDDILALRDLAALDLSGLRMAVLSACWAGDNFIMPGRVVLSLPYTLWRAGARAVLAPLWEIDDAVAMPFMTRFYDLLESMPPRDALQHVQRECLARGLPACSVRDTADPIYWAGFQLYGDGRAAM